MSHDRGCFKCYEDPPYRGCQHANCPKNNTGMYSVEAIQTRLKAERVLREIHEEMRQRRALGFWKWP